MTEKNKSPKVPRKKTPPKESSPPKKTPLKGKTKVETKPEATPRPETPALETFQNDEVAVVLERKSSCIVSLETTPTEILLKKAEDLALKKVRKDISLPGFRKGKVPKQMVEKKYGHAIQEQAKTEAAELAFRASMQLIKIPLLNDQSKVSFSLKSSDPASPVFLFSYETDPIIPKVDATAFQVSEEKPQEIGEKELEEAIKQMRFFYAKWNPVIDRGIQENDFIIIDLETADNPGEKVFADTRFEVSDTHMAGWMKKLVLGKKAGDVLKGVSDPKEDKKEGEESESMEKKDVVLTIKKVEEADLPPFDDALAKKAGAETVDKLKDYLKNLLQQKAVEKHDQEQREAINRFLLDQYPFDMPQSLIEAEKNHRKKQILQDQTRSKQIENFSAEEKKAMDLEITSQSEEAVRLFYLSRAIVRDSGIQVTKAEVEQEAKRTLQTFGPVRVNAQDIPQEVFALALSKVILRKAQDCIQSSATQAKKTPAAKV